MIYKMHFKSTGHIENKKQKVRQVVQKNKTDHCLSEGSKKKVMLRKERKEKGQSKC